MNSINQPGVQVQPIGQSQVNYTEVNQQHRLPHLELIPETLWSRWPLRFLLCFLSGVFSASLFPIAGQHLKLLLIIGVLFGLVILLAWGQYHKRNQSLSAVAVLSVLLGSIFVVGMAF